MKDDFNIEELSKIYKQAMEVGTPSPVAVQRAIKIGSIARHTSALQQRYALASAVALLVVFVLIFSLYLLLGTSPNTIWNGVKRNYEAVQIAFAPSRSAKLQLHLEFAEERIREIAMAKGNRSSELLALKDYAIQVEQVAKLATEPYDEAMYRVSADIKDDLADNVEDLEEIAASAPLQFQIQIKQAVEQARMSQTAVERIQSGAQLNSLTPLTGVGRTRLEDCEYHTDDRDDDLYDTDSEDTDYECDAFPNVP